MTAKDIFELRKQGRKAEAYEAARALYASDKSPYASLAMFWTAVDMLRLRVNEGHLDDAEKIFLALERLLPKVPDKDARVNDALENCRDLLAKGNTRQQQGEKPEHLQTGSWGEELAADYLRSKDYVILERDWHSGHRDIDIIAQQTTAIWTCPGALTSSASWVFPADIPTLNISRISHLIQDKWGIN